ncbi:MAG: hypothetical protein OER12_10195 [Acidimicrobiia bacterium]|nr:hypothetical protein [Acidimicrobiia bacterium]
MLVHTTIRHDIDNCPGFDPELRARAIEAYSKLDEVAEKFGVTIRALYNAAPDHVEYAVLEAPDNMTLAFFFGEALPYKVDYETRVVADRAMLEELFAQTG